MSRFGDRNSWLKALSGLGWPLVIGSALASVFYALVVKGPLNTDFAQRYFAAHPISVTATVLFFIGLAALTMKLVEVLHQSATIGGIGLDAPGDADLTVEDCPRLVDQLEQLPALLRNSYLAGRLQQALEYVERRRSAAGLDEELKYLAESDITRQHESYSLVRIIIWATPMLGFLGTVIGITRALGDLDPELLATDPKSAMQGLLAGLYVAFDTTALALSLSIVLMFMQFLADRLETHLLTAVDERAGDELLGRFADDAASSDPHLATVQRMANTVLKTAEQLVHEQTAHWRLSIDSANTQWRELLENSGRGIQSALTDSLESSLNRFCDRLEKAEQQIDERLRARWEQWQTALSDNARLMHSQQTEMVRQGEVMTQVMQATGDVIKLEQALNENLRALAGARNFEDTVMSLAAAIHLLNSRLGEVPFHHAPVELDKSAKQGRAA